MFTSNINEILHNVNLQKEKSQKSDESFIENISFDDKEVKSRTDDLTFDNIKGISLEEIDAIFTNEDDNSMAKNLRLTTLFTEDKNLAKALFNTVLGQPFDIGNSYILTSYQDKHNYYQSSKNGTNLTELLSKSISNGYNDIDKKPIDKVSQEFLDEVLLEINSFSFLDAMSSSYKDAYGNYKDDPYDDKEDYSFLYNDFSLKYEELKFKYEDILDKNKSLIKQY